jgi:Right handed beta helix region
MRLLRTAAAAGAILFLVSGSAAAQNTRSWVSQTTAGDDVNPCSRTSPCRTFAGAFGKTIPGGEIDVLDPGGYGAVTITNGITIDGGGGVVASILASSVNGVVISASTGDIVTLRNININGWGSPSPGVGAPTGLNGIRINSAGSVHIENCIIFNFTQAGIDVPTTTPTVLTISNTVVRDNVQNGMLVHPSGAGFANVNVDNSRFDHNGNGLKSQDNAIITVRNSVAAGNTGHGFQSLAAAGGLQMNIEDCTSVNNGQDGIRSQGATSIVRISGDTVSSNFGIGLHSVGGAIASYANNRVSGNFGGDGGSTSFLGPF